jgi:peptide/nickel transport system substrate-binding protein
MADAAIEPREACSIMGVFTDFRRRLRPQGLALGLSLVAVALAGPALAQDKQVLVLGVDISDARNFDPARMADYSSPITNAAVYDSLVTQEPGAYEEVQPSLATEWERLEDGKRLRFHLREDVKFWDGTPMTAEDVKFSLDRLLNVKDQPAVYAANLEGTEVVDEHTVDLVIKNPAEPIMINLAAPAFAIYSKAMAEEHGAVSGADAETQDSATQWLNQNSAGTGPYHMIAWERNAQIVLQKNPHYWDGEVPFERVVIRHIGDSAAQLLALQNGDIDAAFNLTTDQLDGLEGNEGINIASGTSLDYVYMTLTSGEDLNPALAKKENRQAVARAIDYDGIIEHLMGGNAVRPANFLPIGVAGSTEEMTEAIGYQEDLDGAKELLEAAGNPDGFSFTLSYANAAIVGTSYQLLAQKIASDLARVGIQAQLNPMDQVNLRTQYTGGQSESVITFWNPPSPEPHLWAGASIERVAGRVRWEVPQEVTETVYQAAAEQDPDARNQLYWDYTEMLQDQANYILLFQPIYRIATTTAIEDFLLTAAGWQVEMGKIKPAS